MRATSEHVEKLVAERHSTVRKNFETLLAALAANDAAQVQAANANLDDALKRLGDVIARDHWPQWLAELLANTSNYRTNHQNGRGTWIAHLKALMTNHQLMENHVWFDSGEKDPVFDVDKLIDAARAEFRIDALFDRVIETLRGIANCDELDSAKAIHDLEEVIAIMQRAKSGSFAGQFATWQFIRRFVPNLVAAYLKRSAISGPAIDAFEQTASELDVNLGSAKDKISESLLAAAKSSFRSKAFTAITADEIPLIPDLKSNQNT